MANNNYEILKSICQNRKSTRRFSDKGVPEEAIQRIIKIAKTSPYASGLKNWDIQVITSRDLIIKAAESVHKKTSEMAASIKDDFKDYFINYTKSFSFFENAPVLIILTFRVPPIIVGLMGKNATPEVLQWERDNFNKSISCVAMLVLLAAEAQGLGACFMTGPIIAQEAIMKITGSKPGREIGAIIPIGFKKK